MNVYIRRIEQPVRLSEAEIHKEEKPRTQNTNEQTMSKRKRWNYEDIEPYRKWFKGQKTATANKNARKLKEFCDWLDKSPETLLKEYEETTDKRAWQRDRKKEVDALYNHLISKGYKINSARTTPIGILSFYTRNCETIRDATKIFAPTPDIRRRTNIYTRNTPQSLLLLRP